MLAPACEQGGEAAGKATNSVIIKGRSVQVAQTAPLTHAAFFLFMELKPQCNRGYIAKKAEFYLKIKQPQELLQAGGNEVCVSKNGMITSAHTSLN